MKQQPLINWIPEKRSGMDRPIKQSPAAFHSGVGLGSSLEPASLFSSGRLPRHGNLPRPQKQSRAIPESMNLTDFARCLSSL